MAHVRTKEPHWEMSRPPSEYRWICAVLIVVTNVCRDRRRGATRKRKREGGERCEGGGGGGEAKTTLM